MSSARNSTTSPTTSILIKSHWGILSIAVQVASSIIAGGGFSFETSISMLGWSIMKWSSVGVWFWVTIFWLGRFFVGEDNEDLNWLFVTSSNFTMLGPILLYWVSIVLIPIGWAVDGFDLVSTSSIIEWVAWIFVAIIASFYQVAWIDDIRTLYSGDNWTGEGELDDLEGEVEETRVENEDNVDF
jgi:hypothetical protein